MVLFVLNSAWVSAQGQITVSGTVYDETGTEPLPGVNVTIEGKSLGTTTDFDGKYSIEIEESDVLVFSYLGFLTSKIPYGGQTTIDVSMQTDVRQLDDVVVIGYGTQTRSLVSSAVSKVKVEEVENTPHVNAIQALQGKVAGLAVQPTTGQPGAAARVTIRGGTQADPRGDAATNGPLYIIDGVYRNSLNGLNATDIESMQVLKDAASTSIYGARAANGIILVTTKSGKRNTPTELNVYYRGGLSTQNTQYPFTSAADYIRVSRIAANRGINLSPGERLAGTKFGYSTQNITEPGQYGFNRNTLTFMDDLIGVEGQGYVDNLLNNQGFETLEDPVTGRTLIFKDNNYNDVIFNTAQTHDLNLSVSGGSDTGNYFLSLGYMDQEGTFLGTGFKQLSGTFNGNFNLRDNVLVNAGVNFAYQDNGAVLDPLRTHNNNNIFRTNNGINRSSRLPHTYRLLNDDGTPALGEGTGSPRNRLHELSYWNTDTKSYLTTMNLGLDWEILEGFSFRPSVSFFRDDFNFNFFETASPEIPSRRSRRIENAFDQLLLNGLFNYKKSFGDNNLDILWGINYTKERREFIDGTGSNAPTDIITTLNGSATDNERVISSIVENKLFSNFGRISYDYKGKYLFSASYRNDGASQFTTNNKFAFFPAFSLGWNIHQEDFWESKFFNRLKLRTSWGQTGSLANLSIQDTQGEFGTTSYNFNGGATLSTLPNTGLQWETTTTYDIGVDLGLLNGRVNILLDYYNKLTDDRIISRRLPQQFGFSEISDNFGSVRNSGFEVEIGADIMNNENFSWHTDFNFAYNRTRVVELPTNGNDKNRILGGVVYDQNSGNEIQVGGLAEGERPFGIWAFDLIGVYATDAEAANAPEDLLVSGQKFGQPKNGGDAIWRDVNNDGTIDEKDLVFVGYSSPDKIGGMVNTFKYKGLQLRFAVDYAFGHVITNGWRARSNGNARNNVMTTTDVLRDDFWKNQGDNARYPRYDNASDFDNGYRNHARFLAVTSNRNIGHREGGNGADSTLYYEDGDFLAFREVSLAYDFPVDKLGLDKTGLSNLNLSLSAFNLGYLTGYDGLTPEIYDGVDEGIYPRPFQVILGINASF